MKFTMCRFKETAERHEIYRIFRVRSNDVEREALRWIGGEQASENRVKRGQKWLVMCIQVDSQCTCLTEPCASSPQSN